MKRLKLNYYAAMLVISIFCACSAPSENTGDSNSNASAQANNNSGGQPQIAQNSPPATAPVVPQPEPLAKPTIVGNSNAAGAPTAAATGTKVPKLVLSDKKVDFGKQPQEKTLIRAIVIKNGGRADLKIDSVVPS